MRFRLTPTRVLILFAIGMGLTIPGCSASSQADRQEESGGGAAADRTLPDGPARKPRRQIELNDAVLADILVTPDSRSLHALTEQLRPRRVFLHMVRSPRRCGGFFPQVPEERIGQKQPLAELLQVAADKQQAEVVGIENSVGLHFLFYLPAPEDRLEMFRIAVASRDPELRQQLLRQPSVHFDLRMVDILAPHLNRKDTETLARNLLRNCVGVTPTALMLPEQAGLAYLQQEYKNGDRTEAVRGLGCVGGDGAIRLLEEALKDKDKQNRSAAVQSLRYIVDDASLHVLVSAATDEDVHVRMAVAEALSWSTGERSLRALEELITDENARVRSSAVKALGRHGPAANELLERALRDEETDVRRTTTESLAKVGDEEAVKLLGSALHDQHDQVRESAGRSLGTIGGPIAISVLEKAVQDESRDVRWSATGALGHIDSN